MPPGSDDSSIWPACACTIHSARARPRPQPSTFVVCSGSPRKNLSKTRGKYSGYIPRPVLLIAESAVTFHAANHIHTPRRSHCIDCVVRKIQKQLPQTMPVSAYGYIFTRAEVHAYSRACARICASAKLSRTNSDKCTISSSRTNCPASALAKRVSPSTIFVRR